LIDRQAVLYLRMGRASGDLVERLRNNHFEPHLVRDLEAAVRILSDGVVPVHAVLLPSVHELEDLSGALDRLRAAAPEGRIRIVTVGKRPGLAQVETLREAGIDFALFEPFSDPELRFVLNQALFDDSLGEVRREVRVPTPILARVITKTGPKVAAVYNLSVGGVYLETARPAQEGIRVEVELRLPGGQLSLPALVISTNVPGNLKRENLPVGMGVRFDALEPDQEELLRQYVASCADSYRL